MERFLNLPGYEGRYQVSDQGNVFSTIACKFLKFRSVPKGYLRVNLNKAGKKKTFYIHQLVMRTFCPDGESKILNTVHHLNDTPTDNRLSNLTWMSKKENTTIRNKRAIKKENDNPANPF